MEDLQQLSDKVLIEELNRRGYRVLTLNATMEWIALEQRLRDEIDRVHGHVQPLPTIQQDSSRMKRLNALMPKGYHYLPGNKLFPTGIHVGTPQLVEVRSVAGRTH